MSKRTITYICHSIFWNILAFLPLIFYVFWVLSPKEWFAVDTTVTVVADTRFALFYSLRSTWLYSIFADFVYSVQFGIFNNGSHAYFLPTFLTWYVVVELFHLFFDFMFFLPKIFNKWLNKRVIK